jgi:predicted XRE-type DNA-binding protein|nr:sporulation transcriptional regulator SpoIIID [Zhaonella formicivorans]
MQDYIRQRVLDISNYIIQSNSTVRQTAAVFGVSKSTVHTVLRIGVGCTGCSNTPPDR